MKLGGSGLRPRRPARWRGVLVLAGLCAGASSRAWAANPFTATYAHDREAIFWILHVSDPHIGASQLEGPDASEHFAWALGEAVEAIAPAFVVNTGDLADGSINDIPASGQSQEEWDEYAAIVAAAGMDDPDFYLDLAGNHDGYGDVGLTYYLNNSVNGLQAGVPYREVWLSFAFGDYLLCGVNTAGEGSNIFVEAPAYTEDQVAELSAWLDPSEAAELVLLFGHHRINRPDNSAPVVSLAQTNGAFWFHGHEHEYGSYLEDYVVSAQVDSIGKKNKDNLAVIAVDHNAVTYAATSSHDPWPLVVITAPSGSRLDSGDENPYAYEVCNTGSANPVRALVFDVAPVTSVSFTAGTAAAVPMTQDPVEPRLWYGLWDTNGLAEGEIALTVTAEGTTTHVSTTIVRLADVGCPEPSEIGETDAGPSDAGLDPDAGIDANAGADALPHGDGQAAADDGGGGCGCRAGDGSTAPLALLLLLLWWPARRVSRSSGARAR